MTIDKPAIDGILCVTLLIFDQIRKKRQLTAMAFELEGRFFKRFKEKHARKINTE